MDIEKIENNLMKLEHWWARLGFRVSFFYEKNETGEFIYFVKAPLFFDMHLTQRQEKEVIKHYKIAGLFLNQFDSLESALEFLRGIQYGLDLQIDYKYNLGEKIAEFMMKNESRTIHGSGKDE